MSEATVVEGESNVRYYVARLQLKALELELKGIKLGRRSAYAGIKRLYGLRGNKQRVYDSFKELIEYWETR